MDADTADSLKHLPGRYYTIGKLNKHLVYRQECNTPESLNRDQLFMYVSSSQEEGGVVRLEVVGRVKARSKACVGQARTDEALP